MTLKQVQDKCLHGKDADQCRFLAADATGAFYCLKKTGDRPDIDQEADDFIRRQRKAGVNPYTLAVPIGDNCKGYTLFKSKMQGYDLDP